MFLLLLTLTLGVIVADAGNLLYEVQQKDQLSPENGLLCPDQASRCSNTATCCKLSSGKWGCCPFVRATCCDDNVHCCPSGYSCNKNAGHCVSAISNGTIPWASKKASAVSVASSSCNDANDPNCKQLCPDRLSSCPASASCCRTHAGTFTCCPYPNNVCCSNGAHCCPRCTVCNWLKFQCTSGVETEKWETVSESTAVFLPSEISEASEELPANVVGEDGGEKMLNPYDVVTCGLRLCKAGQTCCRTDRQWKCCPPSK